MTNAMDVQTHSEEVDRLKNLFMETSTFEEHYQAQEKSFGLYMSVLFSLVKAGYEIKEASKARCLAALWSAKSKYHFADLLLTFDDQFGLVEVLKAVNLLDSGRKIRQLEKKIKRIQAGGAKKKTIGKLTSSVNDLKREPVRGSLSGALAKRIRKWVLTIPSDKLVFFAIHFPKEPWKQLADLLHLNPDHFVEKWFLPVAFGAEAPADSAVSSISALNKENLVEACKQHKLAYTFLRMHHKQLLGPQVFGTVAEYSSLDTLLWWYEELKCDAVNETIQNKLKSGETINLGYGKLMERIMVFNKINAPFIGELMRRAEAKLEQVSLPLEQPVACFGDASSSMQVAIQVATIISSLMTALCKAEITFFNSGVFSAPVEPRTIEDVLLVEKKVRASGSTAPAACLYPYFEQKKQVKTFIIVTDEEENTTVHNYYFAELLEKYRKEVYPADIVFVSFLRSQTAEGQMVKALAARDIKPTAQVRLDGNRPDLTKIDTLLALLSSKTTEFQDNVTKLSDMMEAKEMNITHSDIDNTFKTTK